MIIYIYMKKIHMKQDVLLYKNDILKEINMSEIAISTKKFFRFVKNIIKYRTNDRGVFFNIETLYLKMCYMLQDIYLEFAS